MKQRITLFLSCLFAFFARSMFAQTEPGICADPLDQFRYGGTIQRGGQNITSIGTIRTLVVFVQFKNETRDPNSTVWPLNQSPTYFNSFLDPAPDNPLHNGNLSHFYRQMSFEQFVLYGDPYFVVTKHTEKYYRDSLGLFDPNDAFGEANREVLQTLDKQVDFADYDNWTFTPNNPNGHHEAPDGNVDLIIMFYRNIIYPAGSNGEGGNGIAVLGWGNDLILDGKNINYNFPGSGITNGGGWSGQSLYSTRHEIGHYLFGAGHPSHGKNPCGFPDSYGFYGIMSTNPHYTPTAYERERLRWINYNDRPAGISYGNIPDFITTGVAYRIVIPGQDQAFIIENHQKVNTFFDDPNGPWPGKGLFIYRVDGLDYDHPHYDLMSAEGDYDWSNPYWIPYSGWIYGIIPVFRKLNSNRSGLDGRDHIGHTRPDIRGGCLRVFAIEINGQGVFHERLWGDEKDAFNMGFNQVFSPWSDPSSRKLDNSLTDIAVEITSKSIGPNGEDIFNLTFYNGNNTAIQAAPSKPQDLQVGIYSGGGHANPRLAWATMLEPDVLSNGFIHIERRTKPLYSQWTAWAEIGIVPGNATEFIDYTIYQACQGSCPDSLQYRIRARDNTQKYSVYSGVVSKTYYFYKQGTNEPVADIPDRFELLQNHPNPFNPTTTLSYDLPDNVHVSLRVFDLLGREVLTLVDQEQKAGRYHVQFDAGQLASGIYFYKLQAASYSGIKRMLLLK